MPDFSQTTIIFSNFFYAFFCLSSHFYSTKKSQNHFGFDSEILDDTNDVRERPFIAMIYFMTHIHRAALLGIQQMCHELHNGHYIGSDRHCNADAVNLT